VNFVTLASPHLGSRQHARIWTQPLTNFVTNAFLRATGKQLMLLDHRHSSDSESDDHEHSGDSEHSDSGDNDSDEEVSSSAASSVASGMHAPARPTHGSSHQAAGSSALSVPRTANSPSNSVSHLSSSGGGHGNKPITPATVNAATVARTPDAQRQSQSADALLPMDAGATAEVAREQAEAADAAMDHILAADLEEDDTPLLSHDADGAHASRGHGAQRLHSAAASHTTALPAAAAVMGDNQDMMDPTSKSKSKSSRARVTAAASEHKRTPLLVRMSRPPFITALQQFRSLKLYANVVGDLQVHFCTASILQWNPYKECGLPYADIPRLEGFPMIVDREKFRKVYAQLLHEDGIAGTHMSAVCYGMSCSAGLAVHTV